PPSFLFLVTAPSPSEPSTLSLHDALPICPRFSHPVRLQPLHRLRPTPLHIQHRHHRNPTRQLFRRFLFLQSQLPLQKRSCRCLHHPDPLCRRHCRNPLPEFPVFLH